MSEYEDREPIRHEHAHGMFDTLKMIVAHWEGDDTHDAETVQMKTREMVGMVEGHSDAAAEAHEDHPAMELEEAPEEGVKEPAAE